jgi:hypothetical protein
MQDDVIELVLEETRGDWEQSMEILLGMAGDQEEPGTGNATRPGEEGEGGRVQSHCNGHNPENRASLFSFLFQNHCYGPHFPYYISIEHI